MVPGPGIPASADAAFQVIPAVDLLGGEAVRLERGAMS